MDFFDKLGDTLITAGKDVGQKAKEVSEITKLKLDIKTKQDFTEKQFAALGRNYYELHKDDEEPVEAAQFRIIKEALEEIERMKQAVLKIQGAAECPKCGAKMPEGATFCSSCGAKLDNMFEE